MDEERKPLSVFVKQKTPESAGQKAAPTSADVKAKLMEVLDSLNDTAAVAALAKALAQGGEQQTAQMPKPWEGIAEIAQTMGINLGELWQTRERELSQAREAADQRDKELHELRLREIDRRVEDLQRLAEATSQKAQATNPPPRSHLEEAIDRFIGSRIESILTPSQQLTAEDIRQIAQKAVQEGVQQQQTPKQIVEAMMNFMTAAEDIRKKAAQLGGGEASNGNSYLNQAGNLRSDVLKLFLNKDIETLKINRDYEIQKERNKHIGELAGAVKDNIEDIIGASRDMVREHRESRHGPPSGQPEQTEGQAGGYAIKCSLCGHTAIFPELPAGEFECPNCHGKLTLQGTEGPRRETPRTTGLEI